jgi:hypothetical protein
LRQSTREATKEKRMNMFRVAAVAAVLLCTVGVGLAAQPAPGALACGRGTRVDPVVSGVGGCTGAALLTGPLLCPENSVLTTISAKIEYIQGICGDQPALPGYAPLGGSCGDAFYYYGEACTDPAKQLTQGQLLSVSAWGQWRICYDNAVVPTGDCSGATPVGTVISSGSALNFGREIVGDGPRTESVDFRRVSQSNFLFGAANRNMNFRYAIGQYTTELSTTSCAGGCGFEGCMYKLK